MAEIEKRNLPVGLTVEETQNYQTQLSRAVVERDEHEAAKKNFNDQANAEIKELSAKISRLGRVVERGEEHRMVECEGKNISGRWVVTRLDTYEIIEERAPRTTAEQQQEMFEE